MTEIALTRGVFSRMKCIYCNKAVYGVEGVSVPGQGSAHKNCLSVYQTMQRQFRSLNISDLSDEDLTNLYDLVSAELNSRKRSLDDNDIELF